MPNSKRQVEAEQIVHINKNTQKNAEVDSWHLRKDDGGVLRWRRVDRTIAREK